MWEKSSDGETFSVQNFSNNVTWPKGKKMQTACMQIMYGVIWKTSKEHYLKDTWYNGYIPQTKRFALRLVK